jgi:hypothetical protein
MQRRIPVLLLTLALLGTPACGTEDALDSSPVSVSAPADTPSAACSEAASVIAAVAVAASIDFCRSTIVLSVGPQISIDWPAIAAVCGVAAGAFVLDVVRLRACFAAREALAKATDARAPLPQAKVTVNCANKEVSLYAQCRDSSIKYMKPGYWTLADGYWNCERVATLTGADTMDARLECTKAIVHCVEETAAICIANNIPRPDIPENLYL